MRTTIKMIAERAGVSIGTVDRVLHDRPYVKAEVRERVLRVMEELDYHPNQRPGHQRYAPKAGAGAAGMGGGLCAG